ncbi:MAG: pyruvate kinase [Deltaproteobacteria bacterium]|nr:pyruvate kinase [Deltaproteobacteria bacterium]
MRRTKIVATIGPASSDEHTLARMVAAGMDVARLNFSHGDYASHEQLMNRIRKVSAEAGRHVAVLQDLCGPKIRTGGDVEGGKVHLAQDTAVTLTGGDRITAERIAISHPEVLTDLSVGERVFLSDGSLELVVTEQGSEGVVCRVVRGGDLRAHQGVNLPGARLTGLDTITDKDWRDLEWGIAHQVDYVALSFVRSAEDVARIQKRIREAGLDIPVVAKIEKPEAVEHLESIIEMADAVMVARGDLGVEMAVEKVPGIQKEIAALARDHERPTIVATQMLESMTSNVRPTRAEVSDVANAIFDGVDAVMLSGETASGQYPVEAVQMMERIALEAEERLLHHLRTVGAGELERADNVGEAVGRASELVTRELEIETVFVVDVDGSRSRAAASSRPAAQVVGLASDPRILRRMALLWGVLPEILDGGADRGSEMARYLSDLALRRNLAKKGDVVVMLSGSPPRAPGPVSAMRLFTV